MISVVLLTYNSMSVLPNCIRSLEECTSAAELEVIIADNASSDGTQSWIENYVSSGNHVFRNVMKMNLMDNRGFAYGNNRALECANGEFLMLLNPDTVVGKEAIARCVKRLEGNAQIGAVGCRLELGDGTLDRACKRSFPTLWSSLARFTGLSLAFPRSRRVARYNLSYLDERGSYPVDCLCGAFILLPRQVYEAVGGLDEDYFMYGEDIDWCYRIKAAGYQIWYEGAVTTVHLKGGNGGKRSRESLWHFYDSMYLYYVKTRQHGTRSAVAVLLRLATMLMFHMISLFTNFRSTD